MSDDRHPLTEGRGIHALLHGAHESAVAHAEARRLLRALTPYGILSREALEHECHAESWHDGGFSAALSAAIAAGMIEELPGGFYRDARLGG